MQLNLLRFLDRLEQFAREFPCFTYTTTLSQPAETWTNTRGRVTEHLLTLPNARYFICGSPEMVKDVKTKLTELGATASQLHFEIF